MRVREQRNEPLVLEMVVIIPPGDFARDDIRGIPVEQDLGHELMVLGPKQEPVLPVFMVRIRNLLVKMIRLVKLESGPPERRRLCGDNLLLAIFAWLG